jgi:hypothetical protein
LSFQSSIAPRGTPETSPKIGHSTVASSIDEAVTKSGIVLLCLADTVSIDENMEKIAQRECQGQLMVACFAVYP